MDSLTDRQVSEYFHRSFKAADGLWFLKVEEKYGFEAALDVDKEVWKVLPKIQARMIKSLLGKSEAPVTLLESLTVKLSLEGFKFEVEQDEGGFRIRISDCPWHNLMIKSGREKLSGAVGTTICSIEYSAWAVWASEFDENMEFKLEAQKCKGAKYCILNFKRCRSDSSSV
jgi:hypothetical protein